MNRKDITYEKAVTFSFDDGVAQDMQLVELFNRYGVKATFNLNTGIQSPESRFEIEGVPIHRMEQEGLDKLYAGHEIALHGLTHASPSELTVRQYEEEFLQDARNIEKLYGKYPVGMAYAYGDAPDAVVEYLRSIDIYYGRTVESSYGFSLPKDLMRLAPTCHQNDERVFALAEEFLERQSEEPMLFYVWGHSYEFDVHHTWEHMEKLLQIISGKSDVFYGTNAECLGFV
ncbi:MAG: polysaccharide deacetylase family protein [Lachnospiraceae bacterium]|nr:polysaccharide deacetylase family protein [Lachnospiraceae bacterium]